jgi:hypothetical protein
VGDVVESIPRDQRVIMLSDSVGLGARHAVPAAFPPDWEVNVVGQPARFVHQLEHGSCFWTLTNQRCDLDYLLPVYPQWFGDHAVIAAGYNYQYWNPEYFDATVDSIIQRLTAAGVKHVYWVTLREVDPQYISASAWRQVQPYYWYFPEVNERLRGALSRHSNLTLVDWAAAANQSGVTYDAIHLNPTGADLYAGLIRSAVDQRATSVPDHSTTRVSVPGGAGALAAAVNITTTFPRRRGNIVVHRCDEPKPKASVHNFERAQTVAHAAIAPLDENGDFCITTITSTNLIVDVTGLFRADAGFSQVTPTRWANTRSTEPVGGGETLSINVADIPDSAGITDTPAALALTVTAADSAGRGHVRVSACDPDASHSNVNFNGPPTPNLVIAEPDDDGNICLYVNTTTHLIVDVLGVFDESAGVDVAAPQRIYRSLDEGPRVPAGETVTLAVGDLLSSPDHSAVLNLTGLGNGSPTYFTAFPCLDGRPKASNLNVRPSEVAANAAIVTPDSNGEVCVFTRADAHMIVDLLGEVGDVFDGFVPARVLDTRNR